MTRYLFVPVGVLLFLAPLFVSAATCPNLSRTLQFGSSGSDVTSLQQFLIETGDLAPGNAIGFFGPRTRTAVQKFQCREMQICSGSEASTGWGRVGAMTRARIANVCGGSVQTISFTADVTSGPAPQLVYFGVSPLYNNTSYYIDFGDGSQLALAGAKNPHLYTVPGTYIAKLVRDDSGCIRNPGGPCLPVLNATIGTITITVGGGSSTSHNGTLSASPQSGTAPLLVAFTASGDLTGREGENSMRIDFGDGTTASMPLECYYGQQGCAPRASHTYTSAGSYRVKVITYDPRKDCAWNSTGDDVHPDCASTVVASAIVRVNGGSASETPFLSVSPATAGVNQSVSFRSPLSLSESVNAYGIDYGDGVVEKMNRDGMNCPAVIPSNCVGGKAASMFAFHRYANTGTYTVKLLRYAFSCPEDGSCPPPPPVWIEPTVINTVTVTITASTPNSNTY